MVSQHPFKLLINWAKISTFIHSYTQDPNGLFYPKETAQLHAV